MDSLSGLWTDLKVGPGRWPTGFLCQSLIRFFPIFFSSIGWLRPDTKDLDNMRRAISAFFTPLSFKMKQLLEPPLIPSSTHGTIIFFSLASKKLIYGLFWRKNLFSSFFSTQRRFFLLMSIWVGVGLKAKS